VGPVTRLIGHHVSTWGLVVELGVIVVVAFLLALVWWRGKRRRSSRPTAEMRVENDAPSD
jgi:hypothetical protein